MKAYRLHGPMDLRLDEIPTPVCSKGEVKIKTKYCGLCGSDKKRLIEATVPFLPVTLGHEFTAEVVEVGEGVTTVAVGDNVLVAPALVCHKCENCLRGNFGQCVEHKLIGLYTPDMGGLAEFNVVPEINLIKLPKNMDLVPATFIEPLTVGIHALMNIGFKPGQDVAIVGAGTIGLLTVQAVRAMGAKNIHVFDIMDNQLEEAKTWGADFVYNTSNENSIDLFKLNTNGQGVPYVLEIVGLESTIQYSLKLAKAKGIIGLVGYLGLPQTFTAADMRLICARELRLFGCWQSWDEVFPGDAWRLAVHYVNNGQVKFDNMIDRIIEPGEIMSACEDWKIPGKIKGKIMIDFSKTW